MAAEQIVAQGHQVTVYDAKPSACRKFLLAGTSGMNISNADPFETFLGRYDEAAEWLQPALSAFDADALRAWCADLGVSTFVGSSGRVFTEEMKAAPLVRAWLKRLRQAGVEFCMRHKLVAMNANQLSFSYPQGTIEVTADAVVLAMGGGSWPELGSDGEWQGMLESQQLQISSLRSANSGVVCTWSEHLQTNFAGQPLKNIEISLTRISGEPLSLRGECVVSRDGMESGVIYLLCKYLREQIEQQGEAKATLDISPDNSLPQLEQRLTKRKAKESFSKYLKRSAGISGIKTALLYECIANPQSLSPAQLAAAIKSIPLRFTHTRPLAEAISCAGGVCRVNCNDDFMLTQLPGVFCAGEMLDWEAPTGGYLLTACFATGYYAGQGVCRYLANN